MLDVMWARVRLGAAICAIALMPACFSAGGSEDATGDETGGTVLPDGTKCAEGYTCWPDEAQGVVWVMKASFEGSRGVMVATSATVSTSSTSPSGS